MKINSIVYNNLYGEKKNGYIFTCMTDSICCTPETNTTLKVNYTPIKFKKKKKKEREERERLRAESKHSTARSQGPTRLQEFL